jgi:gluconolactonase
MDRPNGLAFSLDESILYVDDSRNRHVLAFPVNSDLTLGAPYLLINMDVPEPGNPDGMKVDREGNIYVTDGGGLWVLDPAGRHLGTVPFPQATTNLAFGGPDYQTIYVTARTGLYSIRVNVPGRPVF